MVATYDFNMTRDNIIYRALRIVGVLSDGDTPTSDQVTNAATALNAMVKRWQNEHIFLWTKLDQSITLADGTASYATSSYNINALESAFIRDANNIDTPLQMLTYLDYLKIEDKATEAQPVAIAFDNNLAGKVYLWPVPDKEYTLHAVFIKLLADFDAAGDNPDAKVGWLDALVYGLADSLADEYLLPAAERQWIANKANQYKRDAKGFDRENGDVCVVRGAFD